MQFKFDAGSITVDSILCSLDDWERLVEREQLSRLDIDISHRRPQQGPSQLGCHGDVEIGEASFATLTGGVQTRGDLSCGAAGPGGYRCDVCMCVLDPRAVPGVSPAHVMGRIEVAGQVLYNLGAAKVMTGCLRELLDAIRHALHHRVGAARGLVCAPRTRRVPALRRRPNEEVIELHNPWVAAEHSGRVFPEARHPRKRPTDVSVPYQRCLTGCADAGPLFGRFLGSFIAILGPAPGRSELLREPIVAMP
eukprot:3642727-Prymnesium_polylepis.2